MSRTYLSTMLALALAAAPALHGQETHRLSGSQVAIYNLAGHVEMVPSSGSEVVVRLTRNGRDADRLRVESGEAHGRDALRVIYPDDEIIYPEMGRGSSTTQRVRNDGTFSDGFGRGGERVRIRGSGRGLEAWADLVVEVPAGRSVSLYLATGDTEARGLDGDILVDTGSGEVTARDMAGSLRVDTGSGSVRITGMRGSLLVDTGSGSVRFSDVDGDEVVVDTGSGRVVGTALRARSLRVDTGSGSIELDQVASPDIYLDTGSGSVELELLEDVESLDVDTGSGSVRIYAPETLGADIEVETGSGGIDVELPVQVRSVRRDRLVGTIGDGRGRIRIDTGSGGVRIMRN